MSNISLLGEIISFNPTKEVIEIKIDFLDIESRRFIEECIKEKIINKIIFSKPYKSKKTYPQLKRYYAMIVKILTELDIFPNSENIKIFDEEVVKRKIAKCDYTTIEGEKIPIIRSKSDWSKEEIHYIMNTLEDRYSYLNIDWNKEDWYREEIL